jgi:hypothetical protein
VNAEELKFGRRLRAGILRPFLVGAERALAGMAPCVLAGDTGNHAVLEDEAGIAIQ